MRAVTRRFLAAALVAVAFGTAVPASAGPPTPSGYCDGTVDVACRMDRCEPDYPCTPMICLVWFKNRCSI